MLWSQGESQGQVPDGPTGEEGGGPFREEQEDLSGQRLNPYASPGREDRSSLLVEPLRSTIDAVHNELLIRELSVDRLYQVAFNSLRDAGVLAGELDDVNLIRVNQILNRCKRWIPLAEKLGPELHHGLKQDYISLKETEFQKSTLEDISAYQDLMGELAADMLGEIDIIGAISSVQFIDRIGDALGSKMQLTDERRVVLTRKLQTDLQEQIAVEPTLSRYYGELALFAISPLGLNLERLEGSARLGYFTSEEYEQAIERLANE